MKYHLILFFLFILSLPKVHGQSSSASIDSLLKFGVIKSKDRAVLQKSINYYKTQSRVSYRVATLAALENMLIKKRFKITPRTTGWIYSISDRSSGKPNRDSINTSLHALLQKIKKADLLTNRVYNYGVNNIDSSKYLVDLQLIGSLAELSSRLEWLAPEKLMPVANELHANGIVNDTSFLRLKNDIEAGKIEEAFQLAKYCHSARIIDMGNYRDSTGNWLEMIHRDIATILPGLNFTDFRYTEIPDTSYSLAGARLRVSFMSNGRNYAYTSIPMMKLRKPAERIIPKDISLMDFYRIFNKVLIDQHSPYQIHSIMTGRPDMDEGHEKFALIALKGDEIRSFIKDPCMQYMMVSMDSYDPELTSVKVDSLITGWKQMGLFAHLTAAALDKAVENAKAGDPQSQGILLAYFPGVTYSIQEDFRSPKRNYTDLLKRLAKITRNDFKPVDVTQKRSKQGGIILRYFYGGKPHSYKFESENYWWDNKLFQFIKNFGAENDLNGAFYHLHYDESMIYLTGQQYQYALKHNLLDLAPRSKK